VTASLRLAKDSSVDFTAFPPLAALLDVAHSALLGLAALLEPFAGSAAAALAIVLVTLAVRAVLLPLGVLQVRAEFARRRLAPKLAELQRRWKTNPEKLQTATLKLYRDEGVSPFAGIWPALAQVPIVSVLYGVAVSAQLNGRPNELLTETLAGAPLGSSLPALMASPTLAVLVPVALLAVMAVVAWFTRRQTLRMAAAAPAVEGPLAGMTGTLSWLSFTTVLIAAFVPLAAALYLTVSTTWTFVERTLLRRRLSVIE
jgi:YidC/Oxa1 family membrane protein insertase